MEVRVEEAAFDPGAELTGFSARTGGAGAVVSFTGVARADGATEALEIEHYPGMAEAEVTRIVGQATRRCPLLGVTVIHRHGKMRVGENIVLVLVTSSHRRAAFAAAEFLMDWLKSSAPFWKREHHADETVGEWVGAKACDELAVRFWDDAPDAQEHQSPSRGRLRGALEGLTSHQRETKWKGTS